MQLTKPVLHLLIRVRRSKPHSSAVRSTIVKTQNLEWVVAHLTQVKLDFTITKIHDRKWAALHPILEQPVYTAPEDPF